jgi:hypothetical protein
MFAGSARPLRITAAAALLVGGAPALAAAQDAPAINPADTAWMLISAALVRWCC